MQTDHDEIPTPPWAVHNSRAPSPIAVGIRHAEAPREGEYASLGCSPSRGGFFSPPIQSKTPLDRSVLVARLLLERPECEAGPLIETVAS